MKCQSFGKSVRVSSIRKAIKSSCHQIQANYVVFAKENYNCRSYICLRKFGHMRISKSNIDLYIDYLKALIAQIELYK